MTKKKERAEKLVQEANDGSMQSGGTNQERILEKTPATKRQRNRCKGPKCVDAFKVS